MTYLFKLARRTARTRAIALTALVTLTACDTDRLTNPIDEAAPPTSGEEVVVLSGATTMASSFRGGIPFGTWALPTDQFGGIFNGAHRNIWPNGLLSELAAIKARGGKVVLALAGPEWFYQDQNGYFSLEMWKKQVDRYKGVNFTSYLDDGTIIGNFMIDEPNDPRNWNNRPVDGPMLEQMAAYSKQLWPKMATVVRAKPTYLGKWGTIYRHVDVAWAQWWTTQGDPADYIRREVAEAQRLGLGLITGLNIKMGGPNQTYMAASTVQSAGSALLAESYPCAFISWEYDAAYLARADVKAAMSNLSQKAANRPTKSCWSGAGTTPPPPTLPGIKGFNLTGERVVSSGTQLVYLRWTGATGAQVLVYRNGVSRRTTPNDGFARDWPQRSGTYSYKLCETSSTRCSNTVSVTVTLSN